MEVVHVLLSTKKRLKRLSMKTHGEIGKLICKSTNLATYTVLQYACAQCIPLVVVGVCVSLLRMWFHEVQSC